MDKILIIEDDLKILELESDYLTAKGFETTCASDGETGLEYALNKDFDLVLIDVMLPKMNGFEVCKKLRAVKDIPVIFLTAKKELQDKVSGLSLGADDYIVKPFSPSELVARVKAHIARYRALTQPIDQKSTLKISNLEMNKENGVVKLNDKELVLTKKEFDVLFILASKPDTVFSKTELFEMVWDYDSFGDTSTLTVHINRLREKLKEIDPNNDFIKTIWGRGYKFR